MTSSSYYYTVSEACAQPCSNGGNITGWRLSLHYYERLAKRALKKLIARSTNKRFRKQNLPCIWDTEEDAFSDAVEYREFVETIVRGKRPRIPTEVPALIPSSIQIERRAARLIQGRVRQRRRQRQLEKRRVQELRRSRWQLYPVRVRVPQFTG